MSYRIKMILLVIAVCITGFLLAVSSHLMAQESALCPIPSPPPCDLAPVITTTCIDGYEYVTATTCYGVSITPKLEIYPKKWNGKPKLTIPVVCEAQ